MEEKTRNLKVVEVTFNESTKDLFLSFTFSKRSLYFFMQSKQIVACAVQEKKIRRGAYIYVFKGWGRGGSEVYFS